MILIKNGHLVDPASGVDGLRDILVDGDRILKVAQAGDIAEGGDSTAAQAGSLEALQAGTEADSASAQVIDAAGLYVLPGLVDTHVHIRDPGAEYKEDIFTGAKAASPAWC